MKHSDTPFARRILLAGFSGIFALGLALPTLPAYADGTSDEAAAAMTTLNSLSQQLDEASNDLVVAQQAEADAQAKMDEAQTKIDENTQKIASLQDKLGTRARSMYRNGSGSELDVLLGASSFTDFITTWDILDKMNNDDANMVKQTKDLKAELETAKTTYAEQKEVATQQRVAAEESKSAAEASVAAQQAVYDNLSAPALETVQATYEAAGQEATTVATNNGAAATNPTVEPDTPSASYGGGGSEMERAYNCIGAPYQYGAIGPKSFDCSGFVSYCLTGSYGHAYTTGTLMGYPSVSSPQVGDIVVCSYHCGIWVGNGVMIDASNDGVGYHSYTNGWYMDSNYKIVRP